MAGINFSFFEPFFVACVLYFVMTFTVTRILRMVERKLDGPENYIMYANQNQVATPEDILQHKEGTAAGIRERGKA